MRFSSRLLSKGVRQQGRGEVGVGAVSASAARTAPRTSPFSLRASETNAMLRVVVPLVVAALLTAVGTMQLPSSSSSFIGRNHFGRPNIITYASAQEGGDDPALNPDAGGGEVVATTTAANSDSSDGGEQQPVPVTTTTIPTTTLTPCTPFDMSLSGGAKAFFPAVVISDRYDTINMASLAKGGITENVCFPNADSSHPASLLFPATGRPKTTQFSEISVSYATSASGSRATSTVFGFFDWKSPYCIDLTLPAISIPSSAFSFGAANLPTVTLQIIDPSLLGYCQLILGSGEYSSEGPLPIVTFVVAGSSVPVTTLDEEGRLLDEMFRRNNNTVNATIPRMRTFNYKVNRMGGGGSSSSAVVESSDILTAIGADVTSFAGFAFFELQSVAVAARARCAPRKLQESFFGNIRMLAPFAFWGGDGSSLNVYTGGNPDPAGDTPAMLTTVTTTTTLPPSASDAQKKAVLMEALVDAVNDAYFTGERQYHNRSYAITNNQYEGAVIGTVAVLAALGVVFLVAGVLLSVWGVGTGGDADENNGGTISYDDTAAGAGGSDDSVTDPHQLLIGGGGGNTTGLKKKTSFLFNSRRVDNYNDQQQNNTINNTTANGGVVVVEDFMTNQTYGLGEANNGGGGVGGRSVGTTAAVGVGGDEDDGQKQRAVEEQQHQQQQPQSPTGFSPPASVRRKDSRKAMVGAHVVIEAIASAGCCCCVGGSGNDDGDDEDGIDGDAPSPHRNQPPPHPLPGVGSLLCPTFYDPFTPTNHFGMPLGTTKGTAAKSGYGELSGGDGAIEGGAAETNNAVASGAEESTANTANATGVSALLTLPFYRYQTEFFAWFMGSSSALVLGLCRCYSGLWWHVVFAVLPGLLFTAASLLTVSADDDVISNTFSAATASLAPYGTASLAAAESNVFDFGDDDGSLSSTVRYIVGGVTMALFAPLFVFLPLLFACCMTKATIPIEYLRRGDLSISARKRRWGLSLMMDDDSSSNSDDSSDSSSDDDDASDEDEDGDGEYTSSSDRARGKGKKHHQRSKRRAGAGKSKKQIVSSEHDDDAVFVEDADEPTAVAVRNTYHRRNSKRNSGGGLNDGDADVGTAAADGAQVLTTVNGRRIKGIRRAAGLAMSEANMSGVFNGYTRSQMMASGSSNLSSVVNNNNNNNGGRKKNPSRTGEGGQGESVTVIDDHDDDNNAHDDEGTGEENRPHITTLFGVGTLAPASPNTKQEKEGSSKRKTAGKGGKTTKAAAAAAAAAAEVAGMMGEEEEEMKELRSYFANDSKKVAKQGSGANNAAPISAQQFQRRDSYHVPPGQRSKAEEEGEDGFSSKEVGKSNTNSDRRASKVAAAPRRPSKVKVMGDSDEEREGYEYEYSPTTREGERRKRNEKDGTQDGAGSGADDNHNNNDPHNTALDSAAMTTTTRRLKEHDDGYDSDTNPTLNISGGVGAHTAAGIPIGLTPRAATSMNRQQNNHLNNAYNSDGSHHDDRNELSVPTGNSGARSPFAAPSLSAREERKRIFEPLMGKSASQSRNRDQEEQRGRGSRNSNTRGDDGAECTNRNSPRPSNLSSPRNNNTKKKNAAGGGEFVLGNNSADFSVGSWSGSGSEMRLMGGNEYDDHNGKRGGKISGFAMPVSLRQRQQTTTADEDDDDAVQIIGGKRKSSKSKKKRNTNNKSSGGAYATVTRLEQYSLTFDDSPADPIEERLMLAAMEAHPCPACLTSYWLYPSVAILPRANRRLFGPVIAWRWPYWWLCAFPFVAPMFVGLIGGLPTTTVVADCVAIHSVIAALFLFIALLVVIIRPHRTGVENVCSFAIFVLSGVEMWLCALLSALGEEEEDVPIGKHNNVRDRTMTALTAIWAIHAVITGFGRVLFPLWLTIGEDVVTCEVAYRRPFPLSLLSGGADNDNTTTNDDKDGENNSGSSLLPLEQAPEGKAEAAVVGEEEGGEEGIKNTNNSSKKETVDHVKSNGDAVVEIDDEDLKVRMQYTQMGHLSMPIAAAWFGGGASSPPSATTTTTTAAMRQTTTTATTFNASGMTTITSKIVVDYRVLCVTEKLVSDERDRQHRAKAAAKAHRRWIRRCERREEEAARKRAAAAAKRASILKIKPAIALVVEGDTDDGNTKAQRSPRPPTKVSTTGGTPYSVAEMAAEDSPAMMMQRFNSQRLGATGGGESDTNTVPRVIASTHLPNVVVGSGGGSTADLLNLTDNNAHTARSSTNGDGPHQNTNQQNGLLSAPTPRAEISSAEATPTPEQALEIARGNPSPLRFLIEASSTEHSPETAANNDNNADNAASASDGISPSRFQRASLTPLAQIPIGAGNLPPIRGSHMNVDVSLPRSIVAAGVTQSSTAYR